MKNLIKISVTLICLLILQFSYANDGSYYTSGNHLIPMYETTIACKKEILSIKRVDRDFVNITVYYEFFNPGEAKTVEVGFEADPPSGDIYDYPVGKKHPFITDFTVMINSQIIPYEVAIVSDSIYYKNGIYIEQTVSEVKNEIEGGEFGYNFRFVYHFKTNFKKGLNRIRHTYKYKMATSVGLSYYINYVLTAANRWANKQIDDFTLLIDVGDFEELSIENSFFKNGSEWQVAGTGKVINGANKSTEFVIRNGFLLFHKNNFKPLGELILQINYLYYVYGGTFDKDSFQEKSLPHLPFQLNVASSINKAKDETSLKILRNLPYARRGYIFKSPEIQKFYESMDWYIPDPNYEADLSKITKEEQEWLKKLTLE